MVGRLLEGSLIDEQIELELGAVHRGVERYRRAAQDAVDRGEGAALKPAERLLLHWYAPFAAEIRREQRAIAAGKPGRERAIFGPCLLGLDHRKVAVLAMHEIVSMCMLEPRGVRISKLTLAIGRAVNAEANLGTLRADKEAWLELVRTDRRRVKPQHINRIAKRRQLGERWTLRQQAHLGLALIWLLIGVASADAYDRDFVLAFHHETRRVPGARVPVKVLRMDERAFALIADGHAARQHLRPRYQPMLVSPLPWVQGEDTGCASGGYMRLKTSLVKKAAVGQRKALEGAEMPRVFEGVNALGATRWRINDRVLSLVEELWRCGGASLGIPPADRRPVPPRISDTADRETVKAHKRAIGRIKRQNALEDSLRLEFMLKLQVAQDYADREAIYFPHQLDFRGRAYPIPLHLHHQGDDLCRGLLTFADPRKLGPRGLAWLKIHAANCYAAGGLDKAPFSARIAWVDACLPEIRRLGAAPPAEAIDDPFLRQAEKPWQFLAACAELHAAHELIDPALYASSLPVQIDGSCNGLQHYAALGRDAAGGEAVNLVAAGSEGGAPADVYARVASRVAAAVDRDAAAGNAVAQKLVGQVSRRTIKQPVMTSVYGVTMVGARQQVYASLRDAGVPDEELYAASVYLSRVTLAALQDVCAGAANIMRWLAACAREVVRLKSPVAWTTPLGLPVEQPYRTFRRWCVSTCLQELWLRRVDDDAPVAPRKQINGFAPNLVHSLDASHLLMTASACQREDLAMAAVHDSYWTHAADVDRLGRVLREQFIALHRMPILEDLYRDLVERFPKGHFSPPPAIGELDLSAVAESEYFFA